MPEKRTDKICGMHNLKAVQCRTTSTVYSLLHMSRSDTRLRYGHMLHWPRRRRLAGCDVSTRVKMQANVKDTEKDGRQGCIVWRGQIKPDFEGNVDMSPT